MTLPRTNAQLDSSTSSLRSPLMGAVSSSGAPPPSPGGPLADSSWLRWSVPTAYEAKESKKAPLSDAATVPAQQFAHMGQMI